MYTLSYIRKSIYLKVILIIDKCMYFKLKYIGLLIALPFLHFPIFVLGITPYLTYPLILVFIGHLILAGFFIADAYVNAKN
ncbi:MAG: hypothetical protein ACFFCL_12225 [Promethearchaeota archaeon]